MAEGPRKPIVLPKQPIEALTAPIERFLHVEAAGGIVLLACTIVALGLANSGLSEAFLGIWKTKLTIGAGSFQMSHSLRHWINDGLMAIFFFVIGLEIKRELVHGDLREIRRAALPIGAALGGMLIPAAIYLALQGGGQAARGWGIPMATDIAFVIGGLSILGPRVPRILYVILVSLAIVDDLGAILVIAIGYTETIHFGALLLGFAGLGVILVFGRIGVRNLVVYTILGTGVWLAFHESGVHATIAGVILGFMTPARSFVSQGLFGQILNRASEIFHGGEWESEQDRGAKVLRFRRVSRETISPLEYLEATLHPWVSFVIMPVFALANAGVPLRLSDLGDPIALSVMAGLVVGKPLGILLFTWITVRLFTRVLPPGLNWKVLAGGACLGGIGFTMALFIAGLALEGAALESAKVGILLGSLLSAGLGMTILGRVLSGGKRETPTPG